MQYTQLYTLNVGFIGIVSGQCPVNLETLYQRPVFYERVTWIDPQIADQKADADGPIARVLP